MDRTALFGAPTRRALLGGACAFAAFGAGSFAARAADRADPRLVVIVLRGGLDGLAAVGPIGDPDYVRHHGEAALRLDGAKPALDLDGFFALNPAMPTFHELFRAREATVVHATATGYRERSHFDGQDVLESGQPTPGRVESGWLNRAVAAMNVGKPVRGLAVGSTAPLVLRGSAPTLGWAPQMLAPAGDALAERLLALYRHTDPALGEALADGLMTDRMAMQGGLVGEMAKARGGMDSPAGMRQAAAGAARLLAGPDGPRVAARAFDGWDTHAGEGVVGGNLFNRLGGLDGALAEFRSGLGPAWRDTVVVAVTEFGRTVRINGTAGTDHGTATVALMAGGALEGGRVIADWPGLADAALHEGRDLKPTTDLRAVLKGLLADRFGLSDKVLAETVFPDTTGVAPMKGLVG